MIENCLLLAGVMLLGMASPGPDFLLAVKNSCGGHKLYGYGTALGITLGVTVHLLYCALGLGFVISQSIILYSAIKYLGACYLIFIGIKSIITKAAATSAASLPIASEGTDKSLARGIQEGFLCNLLNPKATVFFVSIISQFFRPGIPAAELLLYCAVILVLNTAYWLLVVTVLQRNRVQDFFAASRTIIDRVFGAALIAVGVRVAFSD